MGGINIKLMQGVDDAEKQLQNEKQSQKAEKPMREETETRDTQKAAGKSQTAKEQPKVKNTTMRKKAENEPDKTSKKQVFSFRAMLSDIAIWRAYAVASGKTMEDVCSAAMHEYIRKHRLTGAEQVVFDAIKARDSNSSE